jgi:tRNA-2-methylthio-N6-dimethylallyladenosine synthase
VTLLGQTVNSYRDPSRALPPAKGAGIRPWTHTHPTTAREDESEFPALLRAIAERALGLVRLRYTSPHPRHLTHSLILAHRELSVLARHVHLPVQSGSDRMLKRMIRRYSLGEYKERVAALKAEVPGVTLSTDVIVGFPGETREDFEATLSLVDDLGFTGLSASSIRGGRTHLRSPSTASRVRTKRAPGSRSFSNGPIACDALISMLSSGRA